MQRYLVVICVSLCALLSACTYQGKILLPDEAMHPPQKGRYGLSAALVVSPQQKDEQLALSIDISQFMLKPYPNLYLLMQSKMRTLFSTVDLVDEGAFDSKKYDVVINAKADIAFSSGFQVSYQAAGVDPRSGYELFSTSSKQMEPYQLPAGAAVGAFMTGFTLFIASPITIPLSVNSIGSYAEETFTKLLVTSFDETNTALGTNQQLRHYAETGQVPRLAAAPAPPGPRRTSPREARQDDDAGVGASDVDLLPPARAIERKDAYAIVIGIEQYRQKLPRADFAAGDALLVSKYLTNTLGYPEENVVTLTDSQAALGDFVKYLEKWLKNNVEQGSSVFVYYSGHGAPNPKTGDAYLVPYDGDPAFIDETGYSLKRLYDALAKLPAANVVVALDSCFSGSGGRSVIAKGARPLVMNLEASAPTSRNMTVLAASSGDEISMSYEEKGHGLFTYFLLKGIKEDDVVGPDGSLKIGRLFNYVKPQVAKVARKKYNNDQTPQLIEAKK